MKYIVFLILVLFLIGCKSKTIYVPVESTKTEYINNYLRDSIYLKDSVLVRIAGDTVFLEKYKYLYRDRFIRDSVLITDSVAVPYPITITKEVNKLHTWQLVLMVLGGFCVGIILYKIYSFLTKKK